jgi:ABC-type multidrug transport system ATPase subunit
MLQISYNTGILLTSHSMEECDALCTRLGIMVAGTFRCFGTPQHLKTRWSQGYAMLLKLHTVDTIPIVQQAVQHVFPGAMLNVSRLFVEYLTTYLCFDRRCTTAR